MKPKGDQSEYQTVVKILPSTRSRVSMQDLPLHVWFCVPGFLGRVYLKTTPGTAIRFRAHAKPFVVSFPNSMEVLPVEKVNLEVIRA